MALWKQVRHSFPGAFLSNKISTWNQCHITSLELTKKTGENLWYSTAQKFTKRTIGIINSNKSLGHFQMLYGMCMNSTAQPPLPSQVQYSQCRVIIYCALQWLQKHCLCNISWRLCLQQTTFYAVQYIHIYHSLCTNVPYSISQGGKAGYIVYI